MAGLDFQKVAEPDYHPEKLRQSAHTADAIKKVSDQVLALYFNPPKIPSDGDVSGEWFVRLKDVYYDTEGFGESQVESVVLCEQCSGTRKYEVWSPLNPLSVCIEIPLGACARCLGIGHQLLEDAHFKGAYRYVQCINRRERQYTQYGF